MGHKVIAYDLGTGGIKASLYAPDGHPLASVFVAYETAYPAPDMQEQAPEDWWGAVKTSTRALIEKSGALPNDIAALAISGHSLGVVPVAADGTLLRAQTPIWSDKRAVGQAAEFFGKTDYEKWYMSTGGGFPPECYSVFKMMWYRDHEPQMYARIHKVVGTKDYCNFRLTGRLCTDHSYASGSGLYDLQKRAYRDDYIAASGLRCEILPQILESADMVGTLTEEAARETGLPQGLKVICGGVDNSCMALGARGTEAGRIYTSLGSSAWIALVSSEPVLDFRYKPYVFAHVLPGMYASATCIFSAGSSLRWVRDTLCPDFVAAERDGGPDAYDAMTELASHSPIGAHGVVFNPSLAGGSMIEENPSIFGGFGGLTLGVRRDDVIRAALEGIALNLRVALDILLGYGDIREKAAAGMLIAGGGSKSPLWRRIFADAYRMPVLKSNIDQDAASLGAAALAFVGVGLWKDYSGMDALHKIESVTDPLPVNEVAYEAVLERFRRFTHLLSMLD